MADSEEPRIIVDDDWKKQAQAEKERLAQVEQSADDADDRLPPPTIIELVRLLASQALMGMGSQDPRTGQIVVALDLAQFNIELVALLQEKTRGNLTDEESRILTQTLSELRLIYADTAKAVAQAVKEGRIAPQSAGAPKPRPGTPTPPST
jgi:uncharacterized protein (DUF885 family)